MWLLVVAAAEDGSDATSDCDRAPLRGELAAPRCCVCGLTPNLTDNWLSNRCSSRIISPFITPHGTETAELRDPIWLLPGCSTLALVGRPRGTTRMKDRNDRFGICYLPSATHRYGTHGGTVVVGGGVGDGAVVVV